jgi:hypothetical protein
MNGRWKWIIVLTSLGLSYSGPETQLHLKTRPTTNLLQLLGEHQAGLPKRRPNSRRHILLQFRTVPQDAQVLELQSRGAEIVGYVPDGGLLIAAPDGMRLDGLELVAASTLRPGNKISAELDRDTSAFLVEFHPDVAAADQHEIVRENGLTEQYHPDLLQHHLLVHGTLESAARMAEWDEVAYVFPASPALLSSAPVYSCPGPLTTVAPTGQYVATLGDGWDGAELGSANLGYYFGQLAEGIPAAQVQSEILRALAQWSQYVQVNFQPAASSVATRTLYIFFASGAHGDAYPFGGPGGVLAHTFYPVPQNPEPIAGDMHFNAAETWGIGQNTDIFSVALHEAGHALGLGHSDNPANVMYPYYNQVTGLSTGDISAIRGLYTARNATSLTPAPQPETNNPAPAPPQTPAPPKTPSTDTVPPSLTVTSPASTSVLAYSATMVFSGTATDNVGVVKVTWSDAFGDTGVATGTASWTANVPLLVGTNTITIRAYDAAGNTAWRSVVVTRKSP